MNKRLLTWTPEAWRDYLYWQNQDRKTLKRINTLIDATIRDPFEGMGLYRDRLQPDIAYIDAKC